MSENYADFAKKITVASELRLQFRDDKYSMKKFEFFIEEFPGEYVGVLNCADINCGNAKVKFITAFIDENGNEIAKLYTEPGKKFCSPSGTSSLRIEVYVTSGEKEVVSVGEIKLEYLGKKTERKVRLAAVAVAYNKGRRTLGRNLKETLCAIDNAAKEKPDIILASECFYGRNVNGMSVREKSVELNGEIIRIFRERAKKHNVYIAFSLHTVLENGNVANLGIILDRKGNTAGTYAKTHITMSELENEIEPGNEIKVFDLDFGRVGFAICWDLFFPEAIRSLQLKDCDVILNPTAGFEEERTCERAKESGAYILTSGTQRLGHTIITAPDGNVIARREKGRDYIIAEADLNEDYYVSWLSCPSSSTRKNVFRYERHPELYI